MSISFSGIGSGLPISDWIDVLVEAQKTKIDTLTAKQKTLQEKNSTLNSLQATYKSVNTAATKFTDALHGSASDIFSKVSVTTSDASIVTATVTQASTPAVIKLKVDQLATASVAKSYGEDVLGSDLFTDTSKKLSELSGLVEDPSNPGSYIEAGVRTGSFKINGTVINVNPDMTVDSLIYTINNSSTAGVKAHVEDGQLVLENVKTGANDIVIEEMNSNFVNLCFHDTSSAYRTTGNNAIFSINGVQKESETNTLSSDKTGILGLSLELLSETEGEDPVKITITRDSDADSVLEALQTFVTNFNKAIVDTDTETGEAGKLRGENSLKSIRNRLRTMVTSQVTSTGVYKSLADIGITSGAIGMDVTEDTTKLIIDSNKFYEAFNANPAAVKALLIGDENVPAGSEPVSGLMQNIQEGLETALDFTHGYFTARQTSLNSEMTSLASNISRKEDALEVYKTRLTNQFNYMDKMISQLNTQFSQMQQQLQQIGVTVGSSSS